MALSIRFQLNESSEKNNEHKMDGTCSTHVIYQTSNITLAGHLRTRERRRIGLYESLKVWIGFIWLRIGTSEILL
jgi:hypothetical protein